MGTDYANPDTEVDNAITPGLMRFPGSLKIIISSVHRRSGLLHDKYAAHFGKDDPHVLVVLGTSLQFNQRSTRPRSRASWRSTPRRPAPST